MFRDNLLHLPVSEKKFNKFSVTMNDRLHEQVLAVAHHEGGRRAPTTAELVELGLKMYSQENDFDLSEEAVQAYLENNGVVAPKRKQCS